jgi:hypothetical protein
MAMRTGVMQLKTEGICVHLNEPSGSFGRPTCMLVDVQNGWRREYGYRAMGWTIWDWIPGRGSKFPSSSLVHTGSGTHQTTYSC